MNSDQRQHFLEVVVLQLVGCLDRLNFFRLTAIVQKEMQPGHQLEATCSNSSRRLQVAVAAVVVIVKVVVVAVEAVVVVVVSAESRERTLHVDSKKGHTLASDDRQQQDHFPSPQSCVKKVGKACPAGQTNSFKTLIQLLSLAPRTTVLYINCAHPAHMTVGMSMTFVLNVFSDFLSCQK